VNRNGRIYGAVSSLILATMTLLPQAQTANAASTPESGVHPYHVSASTAVQTFPATYRVRPGDTLSAIAAKEYGNSNLWPALWWTNRKTVSNPNSISVGQHIRLSNWHPAKAWVRRQARRAIPRAATLSANAPAPSAPIASGYVSTGGMSAFEACVISRESGGNPSAVNPSSGAGGLFQFLPSTWASLGYAGAYPGGAQTAPVSVQESAFARLYAEAGTSPWAPYDGC
jgi:hypothetical protein